MNSYSPFGPYAGAVYAGFDRARGMKRQRSAENALATLATNPDDQQAFTNWLAADPESAWKFRQTRDEQYQPQKLGDSIVQRNRQTGGYEALYTAPQKAPQPTEFERILDAAGFTPEDRTRLLQGYAKMRAAGDPIVQSNADGTKTIYPREMIYGGGGGGSSPAPKTAIGSIPPEAKARLLANPSEVRQFDEIFGAGAATAVIAESRRGGAPSQGGATFP